MIKQIQPHWSIYIPPEISHFHFPTHIIGSHVIYIIAPIPIKKETCWNLSCSWLSYDYDYSVVLYVGCRCISEKYIGYWSIIIRDNYVSQKQTILNDHSDIHIKWDARESVNWWKMSIHCIVSSIYECHWLRMLKK